MPWLIEKQRKWLKRHGEQKNEAGWTCKKTGKPINSITFQHSTFNPCLSPTDHLNGRDGNPINRTIVLLYCTACGKEPKKLPDNLKLDDLAEVY